MPYLIRLARRCGWRLIADAGGPRVPVAAIPNLMTDLADAMRKGGLGGAPLLRAFCRSSRYRFMCACYGIDVADAPPFADAK